MNYIQQYTVILPDKTVFTTEWIQEAGTYNEHFDICMSKKQKAIELGAIEIGFRDYARFVNARANESNCDTKTLAWLRRGI